MDQPQRAQLRATIEEKFPGLIELQAQAKHTQVIRQCEHYMTLDPTWYRPYEFRGVSYFRLGKLERSLADFDHALQLDPDAIEPLHSKAFVLTALDRPDEALALFERVVRAKPDHYMAKLNLATTQLKLGNWAEGWANYEARWFASDEARRDKQWRKRCTLPVWRGHESVVGQGIIVFTEQAYGDTVQFSRYLHALTKHFAHVAFVCLYPLARLMDWSFGDSICVLTTIPEQFDAWDWQVDLMSLPRAFGTTPNSVPYREPYLRVTEPARAYWKRELDLRAPTPKRVGIAWRGRPTYQDDNIRSMALEHLYPLLRDREVTWVSLQKWSNGQREIVIPQQTNWLDLTGQLTDFADSAALVSNLDLMISVDSAPVHIAGAIGTPAWLLSRHAGEWRWLSNRTDSVWYDNLRIFRQHKRNDWASVVADVRKALSDLPG